MPKIVRIAAFQVDLPLHDSYNWSGGKSVRVFDSTIVRVGADPETDVQRIRQVAALLDDSDVLIADANTGWLMKDAARVVRAVRDVDVFIEQPCVTYEECLAIRRRTDHPFVLDECIDGVGAVVRGHADSAMDAVNLKISKLGGLSATRLARDLCVSLGIAVTIEDSWGSDVATAAIAHLAHRVNSTGRRNTSMMRCCDAETETETVRPGGSACDAFAWSAAGNGACGAATVLEGDRAGAVE